MNLSTARASNRAKEVGVRKVAGAERKDLIRQFMSESFLLSLLGVLIALPLLFMLIPYLNQVTQTAIQFSLFSNYRIWLMLGGIIISTGLIAGSYPAFYLSAFQAIKVMKGNFTNHISAVGIRQSLVVFQFTLSIILIAGIVIIYSQLNYIASKDLGFDKDQRLIFSFHTGDAKNKIPVFADGIRQLAEVKTTSISTNYLSEFVPRDHGLYLEGGNMAIAIDAQNISTDEFFVKTNGIKMLGGRDFHLNDSGKVLINETLMKRLGLNTETANGTRLYTQYQPDPVTYVEVAGVMKDFNYNSLHNDVKPFMLVYDPKDRGISHLTVAADSKNYKTLLDKMASVWQKDFPGVPFEYSFLDDEVQKQYESEITLSRIINLFTLMAIFISCLGLFGLAAFSAEQRRKEIGIRKVLGANISGIVQLLSKDFLKLVVIAMIIATPVAWWAMSKWLQAFAYRVDISWWMFATASLVAIVIALFTVSFHAIKSAVANPVKSLRTE
jgi:putative ABC transport system permease protein